MKTTTIAVLLLALGTPAQAGQTKLALPGLTAVQIDDKLAGFLTEQLGLELNRRGAEVVTSKEIASLIGYERQKQLLSCDAEADSCVAELGNALGADALVVGDVARVGTRYQLTVKALSTSNGKRIASWSGGADSEDGLLKLVADAAAAIAPEVAKATGRTLSPAVSSEKSMRSYAVYPAIAGGVLLLGGVAAEVVAFTHYTRLVETPPADRGEALALARTGKSWQTAFAVGASVGVAALAAAGALYLMGDDATVLSAVVTPNSAAVGFTLRFP